MVMTATTGSTSLVRGVLALVLFSVSCPLVSCTTELEVEAEELEVEANSMELRAEADSTELETERTDGRVLSVTVELGSCTPGVRVASPKWGRLEVDVPAERRCEFQRHLKESETEDVWVLIERVMGEDTWKFVEFVEAPEGW